LPSAPEPSTKLATALEAIELDRLIKALSGAFPAIGAAAHYLQFN
jgi:hypothetical protein